MLNFSKNYLGNKIILLKYYRYLELSLMGLSLILWFTVCCKDPGMLKKREKGKFI